MSSIESSNSPIHQTHCDSGDNVARDKTVNVFQGITPQNINNSIELVLSNFRERKTDTAIAHLEAIKATGILDENITDMLSIPLNLLAADKKQKVYSSLVSYLKTAVDSVARDLCLATLMRLEVESGRVDDAKERYKKIGSFSSYSQEVFYELIATPDELENGYKENYIDLDESQLNGIIRGAFRTESFNLSLTVTLRLNEVFPSFNSKVLLLLAKASIISKKLNNKHFWTITATLKNEIIAVVDEVVILINESKGTDSRLFNIASPCLEYLNREHKNLNDICCKYVDEIEKNNPEIAARIHYFHNQDVSKIKDDFDYKCRKAAIDDNYREKLLDEIFAKQEISIENFAILNYFPDLKRIEQWKNSGGVIIGADNISADFCNLQLNILLLEKEKNSAKLEKTEEIRSQAEKLVEKHKEYLANLHPVPLLELTKNFLLCQTLSVIACDLIKPILPESDIWVSPIVECYLNCLLNSQQMMTTATVLSNINPREWNSFVWRIQARQLEQQGDYPNAIQSIEEALKLDDLLLDAWEFLGYLHRKMASSDEDLASVLNRVPNKVLANKSNSAFNLLIEIAKTGNFVRAEKILLDWFIENPTASAIAITDFYMNFIIHNETRIILTSENVGNSIIGVTFKKDNTQLTKLLVNNTSINHDCLLDVNSLLGQMLNEMEVGELRQQGMFDITLIERLPPYIAAFRISSELRQEQNDGSDAFFVLTPPENPNEIFSFLQRKLSIFGSDKNKKDEIFNNQDIPLIFKGSWLRHHNPVQAALEVLLTKNANHPLPNFGEENITEIILDVYAITYLALTDLAYAIEQSPIKTIITQETKEIVEQWLVNINSENYVASMGIGENGNLWLRDADNIRQSTQDIQKAFNLIIDNSEIIKPALSDIPPLILYVGKVLDFSVYSSMRLSISNNIPWLCIDAILANMFVASGWKQVNAIKLFIELGNSLDFEKKKESLYLYAQETIPYALTHLDLKLLSISDDKYAHYFLAKILFLHPKAFPDINIAVNCLAEILCSVLIKGVLTRQFMKGLRIKSPTNNGYAEKVFNACCYLVMQCDDGGTSERKLAMLLCKLIVIFEHIPEMMQLIGAMASEFANGHFLNISIINSCITEELYIKRDKVRL